MQVHFVLNQLYLAMDMQAHAIVVNGIAKHILGILKDMNYFDGMYGQIVEIIQFILKGGHGPLIAQDGAQVLLLMNMNLS